MGRAGTKVAIPLSIPVSDRLDILDRATLWRTPSEFSAPSACPSLFPRPSLARKSSPGRWDCDSTIPDAEDVPLKVKSRQR